MSLANRLTNAWNAFINRDLTQRFTDGYSSAINPDRVVLTGVNESTIIAPIINRIAMDVASIDIKHVRLDSEGRYKETLKSGLENCLECSANLDQTGRAFIQDIVITMLDDGVAAVVPTDTDVDPNVYDSFEIESLRVGKIKEWFPSKVRVELYNERTGMKEEILMNKKAIAIIPNPLYSVMNERNSTQQRLVRKLALIDQLDAKNSGNKLDLIIQLPFVVKGAAKKQQAEDRRLSIEQQLANSKYGIAYTDGTERITQLNRPVENNLQAQVEYLTNLLYTQLGVTNDILNGTASEDVMTNYYSRTIEPILNAIAEEMRRKFLTKTARTQGQSIKYFRDPFKLVPVGKLADIADKFTRNEIMSSNEFRSKIGLNPSDQPGADELRNKNLNQPEGEPLYEDYPQLDYTISEEDNQNET